ncbi:MAG TPA: hypothetical protein VF179_24325 [Thermoanaerobaculia bacterium]|nr:hypothetical protein [Thermoanaerobaculia bacterium]
MIHVPVHPEDIPPEWLERAADLTAQLKACVDDGEEVAQESRKTAMEKRREIVDKNQPVWKGLKKILMSWSHNKCWYSEVRDVGSDYHVDHFRPKGPVKNLGEDEREGYWWLAFDWRNYRIAAAWCNSPHSVEEGPAKGKQNQFPLSDGCTPARCPEEIDLEKPVLLDPTNELDVLLVDFDETGMPQPVMDGWNRERVVTTRRVLHLDAPRMIEARQEVWRKCSHALLQAHSAMNLPADEHRKRDDKNALEWIRSICEMLRPDAPLSAVARACVLKSDFQWARKLLTHPFSEVVG